VRLAEAMAQPVASVAASIARPNSLMLKWLG